MKFALSWCWLIRDFRSSYFLRFKNWSCWKLFTQLVLNQVHLKVRLNFLFLYLILAYLLDVLFNYSLHLCNRLKFRSTLRSLDLDWWNSKFFRIRLVASQNGCWIRLVLHKLKQLRLLHQNKWQLRFIWSIELLLRYLFLALLLFFYKH